MERGAGKSSQPAKRSMNNSAPKANGKRGGRTGGRRRGRKRRGNKDDEVCCRFLARRGVGQMANNTYTCLGNYDRPERSIMMMATRRTTKRMHRLACDSAFRQTHEISARSGPPGVLAPYAQPTGAFPGDRKTQTTPSSPRCIT